MWISATTHATPARISVSLRVFFRASELGGMAKFAVAEAIGTRIVSQFGLKA
jgi:hypothetical protein